MDTATTLAGVASSDRLHILRELERKLLWLSSWMIHHANHIRPNRDGLKVGGHQASCASVISIMAALYFEIARPQDRIAVKPHAGPVFHAINYLFGRQTLEKMLGLRAWIDDCPNSLYSALTFQGGASWRQALLADLGRSSVTAWKASSTASMSCPPRLVISACSASSSCSSRIARMPG